MSDVPPKPWSIDQFELYRPELCSFIKTKVVVVLDDPEDVTRRILIRGDVKVGKREMVEYIALRDYSAAPRRVHAFVSAFHRAADEMQRDELAGHQLKVFSLTTRSDPSAVVEWIEEQIENGRKVVVHYDEADYGSAERQRLNGIWGRFRENPSVTSVFYSATPEELLYSECIAQSDDDDDFIAGVYDMGVLLHYTPPRGYCGAARFLDENLVFNARRFFRIGAGNRGVLSDQAKEIIADARALHEDSTYERAAAFVAKREAERRGDVTEAAKQAKIYGRPVRNVITLRLSYGMPKTGGRRGVEDKAIYKFLQHIEDFPELADVDVRVDKESIPDGAPVPSRRVVMDTIRWSDRKYWEALTSDRLILIVMDQTSTRSTEWSFHDRVFATHEYRSKVTYCVCAQAQLRVAHYEQRYGGFQPIRVYGHKKTFEFAAQRIAVDEYMSIDWEAKKTSRRETTWEIVNPLGVRHPSYPNTMTQEEAELTIEALGCDVEVTVSERVRGRSKRVPEVLSHFEPCTPATFATAMTNFKNMLRTRLTAPGLTDAMRERMTANIAHAFTVPFREDLKTADGRWMCHFRCVKEVKDYAYIATQRWGFNWNNMNPRLNLCYKDGVLGFAVRYTTGRQITIDTLETFKSMYSA
jgi:hypothetical protein